MKHIIITLILLLPTTAFANYWDIPEIDFDSIVVDEQIEDKDDYVGDNITSFFKTDAIKISSYLNKGNTCNSDDVFEISNIKNFKSKLISRLSSNDFKNLELEQEDIDDAIEEINKIYSDYKSISYTTLRNDAEEAVLWFAWTSRENEIEVHIIKAISYEKTNIIEMYKKVLARQVILDHTEDQVNKFYEAVLIKCESLVEKDVEVVVVKTNLEKKIESINNKLDALYVIYPDKIEALLPRIAKLKPKYSESSQGYIVLNAIEIKILELMK